MDLTGYVLVRGRGASLARMLNFFSEGVNNFFKTVYSIIILRMVYLTIKKRNLTDCHKIDCVIKVKCQGADFQKILIFS